jgi:hypothetical protein
MRKRKRRLQRHHLFELRDGAIEIVTEMVDVANLRLHLKIQRIEALGFPQLNERQIVMSFEQREPPRIPQMRRCRAGTELKGSRERLFRSAAIPVMVHGNQAANLVSVREVRVECQSLVDGPPRVWHGFGGGQNAQPRIEPDVSVGQRGVRGRKVGVQRNRLVEFGDRLSHRAIGPLVQGVHPLQICVVRRNIERRALRWPRVAADPEFVQDAGRDLVLNHEDVRELAIETLRPDVITVLGVHQLRRDAHTIACLAHAAFENRGHP